MIRGACVVLSFVVSFQAFAWMSNRRLDTDYASKLKVDPRGTVAVHNDMTGGLCSTRFVNPTTSLLAAHCLDLEKTAGTMNIEGVKSLRHFVLKGAGEEHEAEDLAVLVFPEGMGEFLGIQSYPAVSEKGLDKGKAYVIGFGKEDDDTSDALDGSGVKGWGTFEVVERKGGILITKGGYIASGDRDAKDPVGEKVAALGGDSGAAAFNDKGEIIGFVIERHWEWETKTKEIPLTFFGFPTGETLKIIQQFGKGITNLLVDASSESSRKLFKQAVACEGLPCAGNFVGSGVSAKDRSIQLKSDESIVDKFLFDHRTLRTGRYKAAKKDEPDLFLHSYFSGTDLQELEMWGMGNDHRVGRRMDLECAEDLCIESWGRFIVKHDKTDSFLLKDGTKEIRYDFQAEKGVELPSDDSNTM